MAVLDLSCTEAESFYFNSTFFVRPKVFSACTYSNLSTSSQNAPKMLNLSPPVCLVHLEEMLVVLERRSRLVMASQEGEAVRGEAGIQGGTCVTGDGAYI